jgi:hypothetical protein
MDKNALMEKIESLDVKESWKEKFRLYAEAGLKSGGFFPKFENQSLLKGKFRAMFNFLGFFFSIFYYIYLGMYKKAGLLFLIGVFANIFLSMISEKLAIPASTIVPSIAATMVNFDFYRKKVLGENFWW